MFDKCKSDKKIFGLYASNGHEFRTATAILSADEVFVSTWYICYSTTGPLYVDCEILAKYLWPLACHVKMFLFRTTSSNQIKFNLYLHDCYNNLYWIIIFKVEWVIWLTFLTDNVINGNLNPITVLMSLKNHIAFLCEIYAGNTKVHKRGKYSSQYPFTFTPKFHNLLE